MLLLMVFDAVVVVVVVAAVVTTVVVAEIADGAVVANVLPLLLLFLKVPESS